MHDLILYAIFPYVAIILAIVVGLYRYFSDRFSYSSFSSQFLENRQLFWGSIPWHYGILIILFAHLLIAIFPDLWMKIISEQTRLYALEITGLALGLLCVIGIVLLIIRRISSPKLIVVTSKMDWILLIALLLQVISGVYIAFMYRWGSMWYVYTAVPWLTSLFSLKPQVQTISALPWMVKLHIFNAFVVIALFPFSRLVHIFTIPIGYLWRPNQVVIWNRR